MASIYIISFAGEYIETTVAWTGTAIYNWITSIPRLQNQQLIVGLDIEWRPNFGQGTINKAATLQLCVGNKCLIIQLKYLDYFPHSLQGFLEDRRNIFVGVDVESDVSKLNADYGLNCANVGDVGEWAQSRLPSMFFNNNRPGLKELAARILGLDMPKPRPITLSNWESVDLSYAQVEYATIDAYASYRLGCRFLGNY